MPLMEAILFGAHQCPIAGKSKASKQPQNDGDGFVRPQVPTLSPVEYGEREEVLKLRATALKKVCHL